MSKISSVIGVEYTPSHVKLVQVDTKADKVIVAHVYPVSSAADILMFLSKQKQKFKNSLRIICSIGGHRSVIRKVAIPDEIEDVNEYIQWETSVYITGQRQDYSLDYHLQKAEGKSYTQEAVMVATARNDLESFAEFVKLCKFTPDIVDVDVFSMANLIEDQKSFADVNKGVVLRIERDVVHAIWMINNSIEHYVSLGINDHNNDDEVISKVKEVLDNFKVASGGDAGNNGDVDSTGTPELDAILAESEVEEAKAEAAAANISTVLISAFKDSSNWIEALSQDNSEFVFKRYNPMGDKAPGGVGAEVQEDCLVAYGLTLRAKEMS